MLCLFFGDSLLEPCSVYSFCDLNVVARLLKENKDEDRAFDSFWYEFKIFV